MIELKEATAIDPQENADLEEVCRLLSEGKKITDPELRKRISRRAEESRQEALRRFDVREVAVEIVRELRDPK